jgi:hypothetical protein
VDAVNWGAVAVIAALLASPVLLVVAGAMRSNSRYRATKPAVPPRQPDTVALARSLGYPVTPTYRDVPLRDLVARANRVPGWLRAGAHPHAFLTISPDPRRKES